MLTRETYGVVAMILVSWRNGPLPSHDGEALWVSNNGDGVEAEQADGGGSLDLTLVDSVLSGNANVAVAAINALVMVRVSSCSIVGNADGVVVNGLAGGQVLSRLNNTMEKNASFNTFSGSYSAR